MIGVLGVGRRWRCWFGRVFVCCGLSIWGLFVFLMIVIVYVCCFDVFGDNGFVVWFFVVFVFYVFFVWLGLVIIDG